jgi:hypothetical protein
LNSVSFWREECCILTQWKAEGQKTLLLPSGSFVSINPSWSIPFLKTVPLNSVTRDIKFWYEFWGGCKHSTYSNYYVTYET